MCGILGLLPAITPAAFSSALDLIQHRGPDGKGIWQDSSVILGHQRLSILDRSSKASQPMHYSERLHIVFNGEIYNFMEIRTELKNLGFLFSNDSDTEVILAAYASWGSECVHKFNGMWALAIWDSRDQSLFLSRDPMGEKPLFYFLEGGRFGFASEQKALLPFLSSVEANPKFHEICSNSYAYEATSCSLFKGIQRFPAGHNGRYEEGRLSKKRYWHPTECDIEVPNSYDDQVCLLRELLLDSCRLRLRADVPVGTGLSGGVDSSVIAACVSKVGREGRSERGTASWQNAFVAGFPGTVMDETASAREIAVHLGIDLIQVLSDPSELSKCVERNAYMLEEIHEVNPLPHINLYKKMREHGVVVTLDGHGGDELFCGYESSILHALPSAFPDYKKFSSVLKTYHEIHPKNSQFKRMPNYRIPAYLAMAKMRQHSRVQNDPILANVAKNTDTLGKHLLDLSYKSVLPTLLRNYDRYSMINGVEVRSPLLDPRIIKLAANLPWTSKIRGGFSKAILRDAASPLLPVNILKNKQKIGFAPPISDWMRGPMKEYLLDEISSSMFWNASLICPNKLSSDVKSVVSSSTPINLYTTEQIWKNFGIYLWEKAFLKNKTWKT